MFSEAMIGQFEEFKAGTGKYQDLNILDIELVKTDIDSIIMKFIKGSTPKYSLTETEYIVIKSGQARGDYNQFNFSKKAFLDISKVKTLKLLEKNDILINTTGVGTAGRVTLFDLDGNYVSDSHITVLRYDHTNYNPFYLLNFFKHFGYKRLESMAEGSGGQIELNMDKVKEISILIPKNINNYSSFDVQTIIVEFLDYQKEKTEQLRKKMNLLQEKVNKTDNIILSKIFQMKDQFIMKQFNKWAQLKSYNIHSDNIEYKTKRIHSDNSDETVCIKRMGFTPTRDPEGNLNWFTVSDMNAVDGMYINEPNTKQKTNMNLIKQAVDKKNTGKSEKLIPIKKGNILISFKLTVGVVKIYNSDKPAYCNEAIDILTSEDDISNKYLAYNCIVEYPKYGTQTNNGMTLNDESKKEIKIMIPKAIDGFESLEIQEIIVEFIEAFYLWKNNILNSSKSIQEKSAKLDQAFLNEIFKGQEND